MTEQELDQMKAEQDRFEIFNALVASYNRLLKAKRIPKGWRASEWACSKAERIMTLRRLIERHAKPGRAFSWQAKPQAVDRTPIENNI